MSAASLRVLRLPARARRSSAAPLVPPILLAAGIGLSVLAMLQLRSDATHAQAQQLAERARATTNLFSTVTQGVTAVLTTGGVVAESTGGSTNAFVRAMRPQLAPTLLSNAVLFRVSPHQIRELAWAGRSAPALVGAFTAESRRLLRVAAATGKALVAAHGEIAPGMNVIGIATAPSPGSRYAVYGEILAPTAVSFGSLKSVSFAFYLGRESPQTLLAANTTHLPIRGHRLVVRLDQAGLAQVPLLVYGETEGVTLESALPWLSLVLGILVSIVVAGQFEAMRRRRDAALRQAEINRHQALHDALTGLPNRTLFRDRIEHAVVRAHRSPELVAVLLLDLDRFKEVNDTLGHQSGDLLLQALGGRIAGAVRASDTVSRLGGDEFGVLAPAVRSADDAVAIADKLRRALASPVEVAGLSIAVDASVGIALHPEHGDDVDALMRHADIALYRSKALHAPVVYTREHDHYSPERLQLVADLRHAIDAGEIVVHYQPQAPTATGRVESVEALVRWQHPELGLVPPDRFIPVAEHTGMIRPLTRFVLRTALAQCRTWRERGWKLGVAVNVGGRDLLDAAFPDEVLACLDEAGVEPSQLQLEITEDTIFTDAPRAHAVIAALHKRGVRFAIDDFGAGQSSLSYLKRLPVQVLKIDKSFVLGMAENQDDAVIVRSTIALGHSLHLQVVAEGVETAEIRRLLDELHCDLIQGYHLGRPVPAAEVEALFGPPVAAARAAAS